LIVALIARGKKRLNRVFDVIGFIYPDYCFPIRKQRGKRKIAASTSSSASKAKKVKVLTCRSRRIETADVLKLIEHVEVVPSAPESSPAMPIEASADLAEEVKLEKVADQFKVLIPPAAIGLPKPSSFSALPPRKRRMASMLDIVLESVKTSAPSSAEAPSEQIKDAREAAAASAVNAPAEAGSLETAPIALVEESAPEKSRSRAPEVPHKELDFIIRHASGKQLSLEQIAEVEHYARDLKYPRGTLVYGGDDVDDFLYCLPDNKEINVCREMMNNMGFPKLELGLSAMSKDQLADNLAFISLKVCKFWLRVLVLSKLFFSSSYICCLLTCFILQGLILSKALKAQKDAEDESYQMALSNLRSEVITLRNEALAKDKILLSLVERLKSSEAKMSAQTEAHKAKVQELKRKVVEVTENFEVEVVKHEICEIEISRAQKNVDELHAGK
jgi:hypothetical protein